MDINKIKDILDSQGILKNGKVSKRDINKAMEIIRKEMIGKIAPKDKKFLIEKCTKVGNDLVDIFGVLEKCGLNNKEIGAAIVTVRGIADTLLSNNIP